MPDEIKLTITGTERVNRAIKNLGESLPNALLLSMRSVALFLQAYIKGKKLTKPGPLNVRSGHLRASIQAKAYRDVDQIYAVIGSNLPYAKTHEHGATITPKRSQYLTIPLDAAKTAAGVARGRARDFKGTFFLRSKSGQLILMGYPTASAKEVKPLFLLKKSVTVPKRSFLQSAVEENRERIVSVFRQTLQALATRAKNER